MGAILSSLFSAGSTAASSSEPSSVIAFHSSDLWQRHFDASKQNPKLMVVDFSASWCGPCKFIEPAIQAMAAKFTDVEFIKIDVDELSDVAKEFGVRAMPTFVLLKQGKEVDRVVGAKKEEIEKKVKKNREKPKFAA
ncbi:Thioredoxin like [Actinidia chinensis var. chinensis]|uniref:Thioredoxin like n=1 Tax=Actinidia chinensis var. chinensis TaxID=1590841 RepID=A0A2R6P9F6_ACTCC|nr:Thioredoxin like [Actinidia chinensis var. chinensis]